MKHRLPTSQPRTFASRLVVCVGILSVPCLAWSADRIVLRNLDVIRDRTVTSFNDDGVVLDNGARLGWDQVEKGTIDPQRQADFDRMLGELGTPLYRLRQRLIVGDYQGLAMNAELVYARFADRDSDTAYLVKQSLMWGYLADGKRAAAVEPLLRCLWQRQNRDGQLPPLPGARRLQVDAESELVLDLAPVWFDAAAAREALPAVATTISKLPRPLPAASRIYYASLALAAGQPESAEPAMAGLPADSPWPSILRLQQQLQGADRTVAAGDLSAVVGYLERTDRQASSVTYAVSQYWVGLARLRSEPLSERQLGLLDLISVAALHGDQQSDLSAAALFACMPALEQMGDIKGSIAVRRELLDRFPQSLHATRVRQGPDPKP